MENGREFWRDVLVAGGCTTVPRWAADPVPGVGVHAAPLPDDLAAGLRVRAAELGVPVSAVLLAAHAKVLASLTGEREVVTRHLVAGGRALPCRLVVGDGSWRALVAAAARTAAALAEHAGFAVDELRRELGVSGPSSETVFDPAGDGADLPGDVVLRVGVVGDRLVLRFRTDALDAAAAARIVGYHLTALAALVADPDAEHGRQSLLSAG
ncbi:MAG TPA: non-ribosomal peptide synthetase, partial [Pseudonocardia sp.]|nr:non-ribosomal peptide synthetase [Pseudonocardia sp.]